MRRILLLVLLFPAPLCSAQILLSPIPNAISYHFLAGQPPRAVISPLTAEENAQFTKVYDAVLQGNAALDAEGDALTDQFNAYRKVLMDAMIKVDPNVAPFLGAGTSITTAQREEIEQAQSDAMRADRTLQPKWDDLTKKMTAHMKAVDAAMVKLDPSVALVLAKYSP